MVDAAVGFLPTLEAVFRRNVTIARVKTGGKIDALPDIMWRVIEAENIGPANPASIRDFEFTERSGSIRIQG